jgi:phage recombination protein Bet
VGVVAIVAADLAIDGVGPVEITSIARYDQSKIDLVARTICKGASNDELSLFIAICERTGLDPFARQIYSIERWDSQLGRKVRQTQVSIDGARLTAQRSGEYAGQDGPYWCGPDGVWRDVWTEDSLPFAAKVGVLRRGFAQPLYAVAVFSEYQQTTKDGKLTRMWSQMPTLMIGKCAEALALRKAFPAELSGLYTAEEMGQADAGEAPVPVPVAVPREMAAAALPAPAPAVLEAEVVASSSVESALQASSAKPRKGKAPAKASEGHLRKWPETGTDVVVAEKVVDRGNSISAVLCSHATDGRQWVSVGPDLIASVKLDVPLEMDWQWDKAGFFRATRIKPAPAPAAVADDEVPF